MQGGYDVLRAAGTEHQLIPYVRYEQIDTQKEVPAGFTANPATDQTLLTVGASWKPIPEAVLKADYNIAHNEAETGLDRLSVALGYLF